MAEEKMAPMDYMALAFRQAALNGMSGFVLTRDGDAWTTRRIVPNCADVGRTSYHLETAIVEVLTAGISPTLFKPDPMNELQAAAERMLRALKKVSPE